MLRFFTVAARPDDEDRRQAAVDAIVPDQWRDDPAIDALVAAAAEALGTPMAALSVLDRDRQVYIGRRGVPAQTPRAVALCGHVVADPGRVLVVPDTRLDTRFSASPLVTGAPHVRFYAGVAVRARCGQPLGALCVMDDAPRTDVGQTALATLRALSARAQAVLSG